MNIKKHKTLITVFVLLVIFGFVMTYVPLLFYKAGPEPVVTPPQSLQTASLTPPPAIATSSTNKDNPGQPSQNVPQGFSGINEEDQSLDKIENLLNNPN